MSDHSERYSIFLMRHGEPEPVSSIALSAVDMASWIAAYDATTITADKPPVATQKIADTVQAIVCSPLLRARASAERLSPLGAFVINNDAREADLPHNRWRFPRLPPKIWAVIFRIGWLGDFRPNSESLAASRQRAEWVADALVEHARTHGSVLLVGHGVMNALIAQSLRDRGWTGPRLPARSYWQVSAYLAPQAI